MNLVEPNQDSFMRDSKNQSSRVFELNLSYPAIAPIVSRLIEFSLIVKHHWDNGNIAD